MPINKDLLKDICDKINSRNYNDIYSDEMIEKYLVLGINKHIEYLHEHKHIIKRPGDELIDGSLWLTDTARGQHYNTFDFIVNPDNPVG